MILGLYTIYDRVAGSYSDIKLFTKKELALRWFEMFKSESKFADDLQLFYLGIYDISCGKIDPVNPDFIGG